MATRLYGQAGINPGITPAYDAWVTSAQGLRRAMATTKAAATETVTTDITSGANNNAAAFQLISPPLNVAQTITGTITAVMRGDEGAATDNVNKRWLSAKVVTSAGSLRGTLKTLAATASTTELSTSLAGRVHATGAGLTSVAAQAGDRIVVEVGYGLSSTGTTPQADMAIGGNGTDHANAEGDTTGTVPWVEFSQNLTFASTQVTGQLDLRWAVEPIGPYVAEVAADSPVAWWRLDETSGSTIHDSIGTNHGTVDGTVFTGGGDLLGNESDAALLFNASNVGGVVVPNAAALNPASVTLEAVARADFLSSGDHRIVQKGASDQQWRLLITDTLIKWDVTGQGLLTAPTPGTGAAFHVAGTYDSATAALRLYVNGVQVASGTGTSGGAAPSTTDALEIGQKPTGTTAIDGFHGPISEVVLFGSALSAGRVFAHAAAAGYVRITDQLDLRWAVLAGAGTTPVTDQLDLRWAVLTTVADQLDARWAVLTTVADQLDVRWAVRTTVTDQLDVRWAVRSTVTDQLDVRWAVLASITDQLDTRWAVLSTVTDQLDVRWAVAGSLATVTDQLDLRWAVLAGLADQLDLRWAVLTTVADQLDLRWAALLGPAPVVEAVSTNLIGGAGATSITVDVPPSTPTGARLIASITWRGQGAITPVEAGWTERHDLTQTGGPSLAVYERTLLAGDPGTFGWTFGGTASRVVGEIARIGNTSGVEASAGQSGSDATPTAPDVTALGASRLLLAIWAKANLEALTGLPPAGMTTTWDTASGGAAGGYVEQAAASGVVGAGATGTRSVGIAGGTARTWSAVSLVLAPPLTPVTDQLDLRWAVAGALTTVTDQLDLRWAVRSTVTDQLDARWAVLATVTDQLDVRWAVQGVGTTPVSDQLDLRWQVSGRITDQLDVRWAVLSTVTDALDVRWAIRTTLTDQLDLRWAVRTTVADQLDVRWAVLAGLADQLDLRWRVRELLADQLDLRWAVGGQVSDQLALRWVVFDLNTHPGRGVAGARARAVVASSRTRSAAGERAHGATAGARARGATAGAVDHVEVSDR